MQVDGADAALDDIVVDLALPPNDDDAFGPWLKLRSRCRLTRGRGGDHGGFRGKNCALAVGDSPSSIDSSDSNEWLPSWQVDGHVAQSSYQSAIRGRHARRRGIPIFSTKTSPLLWVLREKIPFTHANPRTPLPLPRATFPLTHALTTGPPLPLSSSCNLYLLCILPRTNLPLSLTLEILPYLILACFANPINSTHL